MRLALSTSDVYSNQFLRLLQFMAGSLLAALLPKPSAPPPAHRAVLWGIAASASMIGILISTTWLEHIDLLRNQYVTYGFVTFPLFLLLISGCVMMEATLQQKLPWPKCWRVLGDHAYAVFMAQFFVWEPVRTIKACWPQYFAVHSNYKTLFTAVVLCAVLTVLLQDAFNIPVQRTIRSHLILYQAKKKG